MTSSLNCNKKFIYSLYCATLDWWIYWTKTMMRLSPRLGKVPQDEDRTWTWKFAWFRWVDHPSKVLFMPYMLTGKWASRSVLSVSSLLICIFKITHRDAVLYENTPVPKSFLTVPYFFAEAFPWNVLGLPYLGLVYWQNGYI